MGRRRDSAEPHGPDAQPQGGTSRRGSAVSLACSQFEQQQQQQQQQQAEGEPQRPPTQGRPPTPSDTESERRAAAVERPPAGGDLPSVTEQVSAPQLEAAPADAAAPAGEQRAEIAARTEEQSEHGRSAAPAANPVSVPLTMSEAAAAVTPVAAGGTSTIVVEFRTAASPPPEQPHHPQPHTQHLSMAMPAPAGAPEWWSSVRPATDVPSPSYGVEPLLPSLAELTRDIDLLRTSIDPSGSYLGDEQQPPPQARSDRSDSPPPAAPELAAETAAAAYQQLAASLLSVAAQQQSTVTAQHRLTSDPPPQPQPHQPAPAPAPDLGAAAASVAPLPESLSQLHQAPAALQPAALQPAHLQPAAQPAPPQPAPPQPAPPHPTPPQPAPPHPTPPQPAPPQAPELAAPVAPAQPLSLQAAPALSSVQPAATRLPGAGPDAPPVRVLPPAPPTADRNISPRRSSVFASATGQPPPEPPREERSGGGDGRGSAEGLQGGDAGVGSGGVAGDGGRQEAAGVEERAQGAGGESGEGGDALRSMLGSIVDALVGMQPEDGDELASHPPDSPLPAEAVAALAAPAAAAAPAHAVAAPAAPLPPPEPAPAAPDVAGMLEQRRAQAELRGALHSLALELESQRKEQRAQMHMQKELAELLTAQQKLALRQAAELKESERRQAEQEAVGRRYSAQLADYQARLHAALERAGLAETLFAAAGRPPPLAAPPTPALTHESPSRSSGAAAPSSSPARSDPSVHRSTATAPPLAAPAASSPRPLLQQPAVWSERTAPAPAEAALSPLPAARGQLPPPLPIPGLIPGADGAPCAGGVPDRPLLRRPPPRRQAYSPWMGPAAQCDWSPQLQRPYSDYAPRPSHPPPPPPTPPPRAEVHNHIYHATGPAPPERQAFTPNPWAQPAVGLPAAQWPGPSASPGSSEGTSARAASRQDAGEPDGDALRVWLTGLRLERYCPVLERAGVTLGGLAALTDADLQAVGVTALGPRRLLLAAAKQLAGSPSPRRPPLPSRPPLLGRPPSVTASSRGSSTGRWSALVDPSSNRIYYHDRDTGLTQWEQPPHLGSVDVGTLEGVV